MYFFGGRGHICSFPCSIDVQVVVYASRFASASALLLSPNIPECRRTDLTANVPARRVYAVRGK